MLASLRSRLPPRSILSAVLRLSNASASTTAAGSSDSPELGFVVRRPGLRASIIDGNLLAATIHGEISSEVQDITSRGLRPPNLTVVLVGDDPASKTYVKRKSKTAVKVGMTGQVIHKPSTITQDELLDLVDTLNRDSFVDGLLVQLPLPSHINEMTICQAIDPYKDVDGFHLINIGRYVMGRPAFIPATPLGVLEILKRCRIDTFGKTACIVGRSKNIGFTLNALLHSDGYGTNDPVIGADATTIICHRYTPPDELKRMTLASDIVITATGVPELIKGDMIKEGTTVIDIGLIKTTDENGKTKIVGDVAFSEVANVASLITPVPGGVGPMTVSMVLKNTIHAATGVYRNDGGNVKAWAS